MPLKEGTATPFEVGSSTPVPAPVGFVAMALQRDKKKLLAGFAVIGFMIMLTQFAGYKTMTR